MLEARRAAVLFAIFADPPHNVVFIERASHLRHHAGQIGFPGGAADPADGDDPANTALRELFEELGVGPERVTIVERLPEMTQSSRRFLVTPVIGIVEPGTLLAIDQTETVGVFTVPLAAIVEPGAIYEEVEVSKQRGMKSYALDFDEHHIWGLTGRILHEFVERWEEPESAFRVEIEKRLIKDKSG